MKNCDYFAALMHMHIDGELDDSTELLAHLAECESCASLYREYSAMAAAVRALPADDMPDTVRQSVLLALKREKKRRTLVRFTRIALPLAACAAIATAVLAPGGTGLGRVKDSMENAAHSQDTGEAAPGTTFAVTNEISGEIKSEQRSRVEIKSFSAPVYECPPVPFSRTFAAYIVAVGNLPDLSSVGDGVELVPSDGAPEYLLVANDGQTLDDLLALITDSGLDVHCELTNAPQADPDAECLLIILVAGE